MKLKKEYVSIVLVIIGLSVYIYSRTNDRINYELPQIDPINTENVTRISIEKPDKVILLTRDNGQWIVGKRGYPAGDRSLENLLKALDRFQVTDLVSRSKNYRRYSLDQESAIEVKVRAGQEQVCSFQVGKQASTYRNSYVKLANDPNSYLSKTNMKQTLDKEPDDFLDKVVLSFEEKKLQKIVIQGLDGTLTLNRGNKTAGSEEDEEAKAGTAWMTAAGKEVDPASVNTLLQSIDGLTCSSYLEHKEKQDFQSPDHRLALINAQEDILSLYLEKKEENATKYRGTSKENGFPFTLSKQKGKEIVEAVNKLLDF